ncbi:hypothetical protein SteCoe_16535 [Stentor coeruleus]|uniref:EF-hand domain-containing protein n=1 Tax=Stentor coeruleus TaxID=5963 RepID=A0A1R2C144_9CILI|nr:hypothetical protein SteCoe_16535 [Stentor coeruleus]
MQKRQSSQGALSTIRSSKTLKPLFPSFSSTSTSITSKPEVRTWLRTRGKRQYIGFDDEERIKLRKYFSSLDENNNGCIGFKELEDPLIALGLAETRQQVEEMVRSVDFDGSGYIEFEEFLTILKGSRGNAAIANFFKGLIEGTLIKDAKTLPFKLVVSAFRRRMLMDSLMTKDVDKKEKGEKVMRAFARQISVNKKLRGGNEGFNADLRIGFPKLPRIIEENEGHFEKVKEILRKKK